MAKYILIIIILVYALWAVRKIYINRKTGSCCGGSCSGCSCNACKEKQKDK